jgi:hypothetical protein
MHDIATFGRENMDGSVTQRKSARVVKNVKSQRIVQPEHSNLIKELIAKNACGAVLAYPLVLMGLSKVT